MWLPWVGGCGDASAGSVHSESIALERAGDPLKVRVTWADGDGPMPVIVFSHGLGGSGDNYQPLARAWAEHGFLVVQPTHPDSLAEASSEERRALIVSRTPTLESIASWDERPGEVALVLDQLDRVVAQAGAPADRVDAEHVGIGGHSFGAHTSMLCGGVTHAGSTRFAEPRADAILLMSPQGTGGGLTERSYATLTAPAMVVTGSEDRGMGGQAPDWRLEPYRGLGSPDKWLLYLEGGTHALGGVSGLRFRADEELLPGVLEATTLFWEANLRGDAGARARLDQGRLDEGGPRLQLTRGATAASPPGTGGPR